MSAIKVAMNFQMLIQEILTAAEAPAIPAEAQRILSHSFPSVASMFDSTTSPAAGFVIAKTYTIAGSPTTIDLTAAPKARDSALSIDLTGKKLGGYVMYAHKSNTGVVTIKQHATNGYNFTGVSGGGHVLDRGQIACLGWDQLATGVVVTQSAPAVAAGAKQLDLSGTVPTTDFFTMLAWFTP